MNIKQSFKELSHNKVGKVTGYDELMSHDTLPILVLLEATKSGAAIKYMLSLAEETYDTLVWLAFELNADTTIEDIAASTTFSEFKEHAMAAETLFLITLDENNDLIVSDISYSQACAKKYVPLSWME